MFYSKKMSFYIFFLSLFIIDLWAFFFFERQLLYCLLAFFCLSINAATLSAPLLCALFLLCIESWVINGHFGLCLLYLIPLGLVNMHIAMALYQNKVVNVLVALVAIMCQIILIEGLILGGSLNGSYTFAKIFVNIMLVGIYILKK
jgi:hypothetical protein